MKTKKIVILSIIFALMITFLIFFPLNAIVPLIALIVIAETGDIKLAGLGGLLFGIASFLAALLVPSSPLYVVFLNPLVSVIPRIIVGLTIYAVYKGLFKVLNHKLKLENNSDLSDNNIAPKQRKRKTIEYISLTAGAISGAVINTVLVLGTMFLLYNNHTYTLNEMSILVRPEVILPLISLSAITEPVFCAIIAPPIVTALKLIR